MDTQESMKTHSTKKNKNGSSGYAGAFLLQPAGELKYNHNIQIIKKKEVYTE